MQALEGRAEGRAEVYEDIYFDNSSGDLDRTDRELRVRTVHGRDAIRSLLTYKGARVDDVTRSKPEHETAIDNPEAVRAPLRGLGHTPSIAFSKHCRNYEFGAAGRRMLATLVRVPELDGTFLELETMVNNDLTNELYTDAVAARR
ncbi:class IV adenylate cyclase [Streptacidiphilus sp. N1-12]|uniref:Class IV adenylate cyclase n=2 Tax=Streptacidiphilus alkalitolerans TaxID=3342712 RepID=A0ABV6WGU9_9ACTN